MGQGTAANHWLDQTTFGHLGHRAAADISTRPEDSDTLAELLDLLVNSHCTCSGSRADVASSSTSRLGLKVSAPGDLQYLPLGEAQLSGRPGGIDSLHAQFGKYCGRLTPQSRAVDAPESHPWLTPVEEVVGHAQVGHQAQLNTVTIPAWRAPWGER